MATRGRDRPCTSSMQCSIATHHGMKSTHRVSVNYWDARRYFFEYGCLSGSSDSTYICVLLECQALLAKMDWLSGTVSFIYSVLSDKSQDVNQDYPLSTVATERSQYGPDSAQMRTDTKIERNSDSDIQTAEISDVPSIEQSSEHESGSEHTDMDLDADEEDETVHQLLLDFTDMVIERYTQDNWFSIPININKLILDEKGLYWRKYQLAIPEYASLIKNCKELPFDSPWSGHFG